MPRVIADARARRIAAEWHGGQWSPLYMFCSSGATQDSRYTVDDVIGEVEGCSRFATTYNQQLDLDRLVRYLRSVQGRGAVPGWADINF
jgi:hypothetical protein